MQVTQPTDGIAKHTIAPRPGERFTEEDRRLIDEDFRTYDRCVEYVRANAAGVIEGVYGPKSLYWMITREAVILSAGLPAIALEIAHPIVAAGVDQHSDFERNALGRARRTLTASYDVVFGDLTKALGASRRLRILHARVIGDVPKETSSPLAGRRFRANDPEALLWVQATLIDCTLRMFEALIRPLTPEEKDRYYAEAHLSAALVGIEPSTLPRTLADFYDYYNSVLDGPVLAVGPTGRRLYSAIFNSPYTRTDLDEIWTAGFLPPRVREAAGLPWNDRVKKRHERMCAAVRRAARSLPEALRYVPAYHQAQLRVAAAQGRRGTTVQRIVNSIDALLERRGLDLPGSLRPIDVSDDVLETLEQGVRELMARAAALS